MTNIEIPKIFWKYYDLFRRGKITVDDFSSYTGLDIDTLETILMDVQ